MPLNNFLLFDQNKANLLTDAEYSTAAQRLNGVQTGVASSQLQNKFSYQMSLMAYALAQLMNANGLDASDALAVTQFVNNLDASLLSKVKDKATEAEAKAAILDTKWMTPFLTGKLINSAAVGWQLLTKWENAGTYTWTVPDLFGSNAPYDIGIFLIGGGGSGGLYTGYSIASNEYGKASGGASGRTNRKVLRVTPGQTYQVKVGAGGARAVSTTTSSGANGKAGEQSAFSTIITADGGMGGFDTYGNNNLPTSFGGQNSSLGAYITHAPADGVLLNLYPAYPLECINPFNEDFHLSAGGFALCGYGQRVEAAYLEGQSAGFANYGSGAGITGHSEDAGKPGFGSGGCALATGSTSSVNKPTGYSGKGADGACYIYVQSKLALL